MHSILILASLLNTALVLAAPQSGSKLTFGPGPVVTCTLQLYQDAACQAASPTEARLYADDTCVDTAGYLSYKITGFCPRGIHATEYPDADCKASGIVEPVFNATGNGCHAWEVYNPTSIRARGN